jgi:phage terminase small subunit
MAKKGLNERHKKFCEVYADCLNITKAYMEVYPNTSPEVASASGSRLLGNEKIQSYIQELIEEQKDRRVATIEEAQAVLTKIFRCDNERSSDRINAIDKLLKSKGAYFEGTKADTNINVTVTGATSDWSK